MFDMIAFDADDTLWHNEPLYTDTKEKFQQILTHYHSEEWIGSRLDDTEIQNLDRYGYGIKSFTLSMIETAIELTEGRVTGTEVHQIIGFAWEMLMAPLQILDGVPETIAKLAESYPLMVITKGDLFEQEAKIARSGLGEYFRHIEIVSEKNQRAYESITAKYKISPHRFLMIGNSLKSDILPVVAMGGRAIHIPYQTTWFHEMVSEAELEQKEFMQLERISLLPQLLAEINHGGHRGTRGEIA